VGGGSTELVVGRGGRPVLTASLPLGALTVCRRWLGADPIARHRVRAARRFIAGALRARAGAVERFGFTAAVGTGGSIQRLARIAAALKGAPTEDVHGHFLDTKALDAVVERLVHARTQAERLALPGMDPDRADTLLGGALIFQALAHLLRLDGWRVSMTALRTGLLVDTHRRAVG
ncbi:MAG: hypothetical protein KC620_06810, partial [Myxococcales bacterium]|nr:hypothetical protein [Myxococcales bacterium]